jgi:hypothetical protein
VLFRRKKKCLRYTENETTSVRVDSWTDEDDTDNSDDCDVIPMIETADGGGKNSSLQTGIFMDSDEENKSRLLLHQQTVSSSSINEIMTARKDSSSSSSSSQVSYLHPSHQYPYFDSFLHPTSMPILNGFKQET